VQGDATPVYPKGKDGSDALGVISLSDGLMITNYNDERYQNKAVAEVIRNALQLWSRKEEIFGTIDTSRNDSELVWNDWTKEESKNGEVYMERLAEAGRPDLYKTLFLRFGEVLQSIYREFSEKYGWGNPGQLPVPRHQVDGKWIEYPREELESEKEKLDGRGLVKHAGKAGGFLSQPSAGYQGDSRNQDGSDGIMFEGYDWERRMSRNAVSAYEEGLAPLHKWTKAAISSVISAGASQEIADVLTKGLPTTALHDLFLRYSEWHHTGMRFSQTDFYRFNDSPLDGIETVADARKIVDAYNAYAELEGKRITATYTDASGRKVTEGEVYSHNRFNPDSAVSEAERKVAEKIADMHYWLKKFPGRFKSYEAVGNDSSLSGKGRV